MLSLSGRDFNDTDYSIDRCAALKFCPGALDLIDMSKKNQVCPGALDLTDMSKRTQVSS